ncbi:hypothetical protein SPRG_02793 [Saprolegnia parasitica CBS 223.65]|uniref:Uncharacterized protein n=1 Tax=Saprolegnia parasitica (strain CBS 223.65) TaxID=695850 RepID=A0A067CNQ2_SAPPC|nr:hypothetical protein SPRG_02793 [Saprolegnia parasitica CBS 223.65]KDO32314.1 hypothetical protein SPRG_02793 [Saprolegnia parasitica CBS 223.65]|eukprot:XP_012196770.1 hypothetical protein SPRG_02793 [Saprolegnia parasitica CBS 223.65]
MTQQSPMRMFIMLPMMFLMGKIDFENELILNGARACFLVCQVVSLLLGLYAKSKVEAKKDTTKIFVPTPKSPLDTSTENSPLTETTYYDHELAKAKEFIQQTAIGAAISSFIHLKFGVNQVVVIQSVMIPLNLYDNVILKKHIFGIGGPRYWDERLEGESLNAPVAATEAAAVEDKKPAKAKKTANAADAIVKAWDMGVEANFEGLMSILLKNDQIKTKTTDGWTALMVACGSALDTEDIIKRLVNAGVPVREADNDGWTALHWCAFHGRPEAAQVLLAAVSKDDAAFCCRPRTTRDNADVAEVIASTDGLRQRKTAAAEATPIDDVD